MCKMGIETTAKESITLLNVLECKQEHVTKQCKNIELILKPHGANFHFKIHPNHNISLAELYRTDAVAMH